MISGGYIKEIESDNTPDATASTTTATEQVIAPKTDNETDGSPANADGLEDIRSAIKDKTHKNFNKNVLVEFLVRSQIAHDPSETKAILFGLLVDGLTD